MKSIRSTIAIVALLASAVVAGGTTLVSTTVASAAAVKPCVASQIKVTHGPSDGTAGTVYFPIIFTNTGATCTIFGVPAIQSVSGATHRKVGPSAKSVSIGLNEAQHSVTKGHSVSSAFGVVDTGNFPPSTCVAAKASGILVSLGNFVHSTYVALAITVCTKRASTTTRLITAGVSGNY